jgi:hypothetical protein
VKEITAAITKTNDRACILTAGLIEEDGKEELTRGGEKEEEEKKRGERCLLKRSRAGRRSAKLQGSFLR